MRTLTILNSRPGNLFAKSTLFAATIIACSCLFLSTSWAQGATPANDRPWTTGVSAAQQKQALSIFNQGNTFFETSQYSLATEQYREALKSWQHPAIHFNMVVCLINLDQPMAAYEHLQESLKWGADPLGSDVHARALTYQKLLEKQLSYATIKSDQKGVKVTFDGKVLFIAPGESTFVALPGAHQLVASKDGFMPLTAALTFVGGEKSFKDVKLIPLAEAQGYRIERYWAKWMPWTVFGAGAATAALGLGGRVLAKGDFDRYDNDVAVKCPPQGCAQDELPQATKDVQSRARLEDQVSSVFLVAGIAATATGLALIVINRERTVKETLPTISPVVTPDGASVWLTFPID